jgi:hypothetical protein
MLWKLGFKGEKVLDEDGSPLMAQRPLNSSNVNLHPTS